MMIMIMMMMMMRMMMNLLQMIYASIMIISFLTMISLKMSYGR